MRYQKVFLALLLFSMCLTAVAEDFDGIPINSKQTSGHRVNILQRE